MFATTAEIDGFYPPNNHWDTNGYLYANAVFDPLLAVTADGTVQPYLAESISGNATNDVWTVTLRPDVHFSDGSLLTSGVVKANVDALRASSLSGALFKLVGTVDYPDERTVVFRLTGSSFAFPAYLTSQIGYVVGEAMVRANGLGNPIGTGPFTYSDWAPNDHFTAVRNPHYWRAGLPYLDQVIFRPIPDTTQRESTLKTGAVDVILSLDASTVRDFTGRSDYQLVDSRTGAIGQPTMGFLMVNTAVAPTDDLRVRQALAKSLDQRELQKLFGAGFSQPVNGMFLPGSPYYNDTGYPSFDQVGARSLVSAYKASHGTPSVQISTVASPFLTQVSQVVQQMWQSVGIRVSIKSLQQADLISAAVMGEFQVATWAQFGAIDPDLNYLWLSSTTVAPVGSIGLNFPRNDDNQLQAALALGRASSNPVTRQEAYRTVNDRLAHDLPYLWTGQTLFSIVAEPRVRNVGHLSLPSGAPGYGFNEGVVHVSEMWLGG